MVRKIGVIASCLLASVEVRGAAGDLDVTFGNAGLVLSDVGGGGGDDEVLDIEQMDDGRIVALTRVSRNNGGTIEFWLARFLENGPSDKSFGNRGRAPIIPPVRGPGNLARMAVRADGSILVSGSAWRHHFQPQPIPVPDTDFLLMRFRPDGSMDSTHGYAGAALADLDRGSSDVAMDVTVQPDGKVVVAGYTTPGIALGTPSDFATVRFLSDGTLDQGFADHGISITPVGTWTDYGWVTASQPDGRILVCGPVSNGPEDFGLVRYLPAGGLDPGFGVGGRVILGVGGAWDLPHAILLQEDGKILVAGSSWSGVEAEEDFALVRLLPDGRLDLSFGTGGKVVTNLSLLLPQGMGIRTDIAYSVGLQNDGKIVVAGRSTYVTTARPALVRYSPDGSLDPAFGDSGVLYPQFADRDFSLQTMLVQPDGAILCAGSSRRTIGGNTGRDLMLVRFNGGDNP